MGIVIVFEEIFQKKMGKGKSVVFVGLRVDIYTLSNAI